MIGLPPTLVPIWDVRVDLGAADGSCFSRNDFPSSGRGSGCFGNGFLRLRKWILIVGMDLGALGADHGALGMKLHCLGMDLVALGVDLGALGMNLRCLGMDLRRGLGSRGMNLSALLLP